MFILNTANFILERSLIGADFDDVLGNHFLACEQAHIWEHTHERQRANSKPERSFREESGDEGRRK